MTAYQLTFGSVRVVLEDEEGEDGNKDGDDALHDPDPLPTSHTTEAVYRRISSMREVGRWAETYP